MPTVRLVLEYDGTDFCGWQSQSSVRTVEGELRDALHQVTGETPRLTAAGRTDAGAHAHGQVVGVPLAREWEPQRLTRALNAVLPDDVAVREVRPTPDGFHARFDAERRTYRYVVAARRQRSPVLRRYAWQVSGDLDVAAMREAAALLRGSHDFGAFGRSPRPGGSTVRTVLDVSVHTVDDALPGSAVAVHVIEVSADAFLSGMMRGFTGALVAVGRGRLRVDEVAAMIADPEGRRSALVAPARGLHQWTVTYPPAPATETQA